MLIKSKPALGYVVMGEEVTHKIHYITVDCWNKSFHFWFVSYLIQDFTTKCFYREKHDRNKKKEKENAF